MPADSVIPQIPGQPVDPRMESMLRQQICSVVGIQGDRFIGAQPISFSRESINELHSENYFMSEKSDGVRVLLYCMLHQNGQQQVFLVDRKNKFFYVPQLRFVLPDLRTLHHNTIVDGELVTDTEPNGQQVVRFLVFDMLASHGQNLMSKPLTSRLGRIQSDFVGPYREMLKTAAPEFVQSQPFRVSLKEVVLAYGLEKMFKDVIPNLKHGSDGLIFTSSVAPYVPSTNSKMLKWKPPSENTVDFKLSLQFQSNSQKPRFMLAEWQGGQNYTPFGEMIVDDDLWEHWRSTSTKLEQRVVEVNYSPQLNGWRFFRFRDDKEHGNHSSVVRKVVESIRDGVEQDELMGASTSIRNAWKDRERIQHQQQQQQYHQ